MKPYLITTGTVFALLTGAHIWRIIVDGPQMISDPWFTGGTIVSVAMCAWAVSLLRSLPARGSSN